MITFTTTQLLHLPLDGIENGKVVDSSGKGNDGTVQGTPQILPDDTLGACLSLDGSTQYIDLSPASLPSGNEITVSFWAYGGDALPKNCAIIEATDAKGMTTLSIRVPWGDSMVYFSCGNDGSSVDSISQAAQSTDFKGAWTYWAFTKNATTGNMNIYRNGTLWLNGTGKSKPLPASTVVKVGATADGNNRYQGKIAHVRVYNQALAVADIARDMEADQTALSSFRKSYPIDFRLYNDDEQEVLDITDDPAGQNLHLEVSNASGQVINLTPPAPGNSTPGANNYHFALRFRPDTLSALFQTYAAFTAFALQTIKQPESQAAKQPESQAAKQPASLSEAFQLFAASAPPTVRPPAVSHALQSFAAVPPSAPQGAQPPAPVAPSSALQAFAVDTASALQGALQQQGWNIGYQQEPGGTVVVYFLSTKAQSLAPGTKVAVTFPHVSASGAGGARGTRVELRYQQMTFGDGKTPVSGSRQIYLSIVNQRGQKQIPLHASFVGFNSILNDGQAQNTLTLRITNTLKDGTIALNPAGSSAPSKFILSFDVQTHDEDWALGTLSQVHAIQVTVANGENWSLIPPSGQEESPEWILTPQPSKTALTADEEIQLTLANIISSLPPGQTNLYIGYENIPGYWDGQLVVAIEKTPLIVTMQGTPPLYLVGIGTIHPQAKLTVSASGQLPQQQPQHLQLRREATEKSGDKLLFLELYQDERDGGPPTVPEVHPSLRFHHHNRFWQRIEGRADGIHFKTGDLTSDGYIDIFAGSGHFSGNVGIGTPTPRTTLEVKGNDFQLAVTNAQEHNWGLVNWTDDKLYFQYREQGVYKNNAMYLDKNGLLVVGSLGMGSNSLQQGVNFTGGYQVQFQSPSSGSYTLEPLVAPNAIRIVGDGGGVLAVKTGDVLAWAAYGVVIKGNLFAQNKYFLIDHPTRPDHQLIHACLEGPESGVYYRGQAQLKNGQATIRLPDYFEALTRQEGRTVLLTPKGREPFLLSHEDIVDGTFKVYGTRADGAFSWEVKAVRADVGRLEVEVRK